MTKLRGNRIDPRFQRIIRAQQTGGGAEFSPLDISGIVLWIDPSDSSTITFNGSDVSAISDKSGNGRDFEQNTASLQPTTTTVGGLDWLAFDTDALLGTATNTFDWSADWHIFVVVRDILDTGNLQLYFGVNGTTRPVEIFSHSGTNVHSAFIVTGAADLLHTDNENAIVEVTQNTTETELFVNSVSTDTALDGNSAGTTDELLEIGGRSGGSLPITGEGKVGEIIVYDSVLSAADQLAVQNYLARWSLA